MENLAIRNGQITEAQGTEAQAITADLFRQFVAYIDRGERTTRAYLGNLKQFLLYLQAQGIRRPGRETVLAYRDDMKARGLKPATINAYLRSVKQFFAWTAAAGIYPDIAQNVHGEKVDNTTHKKDCLTAGEVLEVEKSIDRRAEEKAATAAGAAKDTAGRVQRATEQGLRERAIYLLAVNAGLRTVEISRANVRDLEEKAGQSFLYVWGKGHAEADQKKALAPEVAQAIREYLAARTDRPAGSSPLFVATGNRSGGKRLASTTISTMLKRALQDAGYNSDRLTAHSLRHTAGTAAYTVTNNLVDTQHYMRHANPATTEIYMHIDTEKQDAKTAALIYSLYHGSAAAAG